MPISFSQAYKEAVASARQDVTYIDTLVITPPTNIHALPVFRFVRADVDIEINGVLHTGQQFEYTMPQLEANTGGTLNITITNMPQELALIIDMALESLTPIMVQFVSYIAGTVADTATLTTQMEVKSISIKGTDLVLTTGYPDTVNKRVPVENYTPQLFPGLRAA